MAGLGAIALALPLPLAGLVAAAAVVGLASGLPFAMAFTGAAAARPDSPGAAVGFVNGWAALVIVAGSPLVGLTFSLPGDGRIGFVVLGVLAALAALATRSGDAASCEAARFAGHGMLVLRPYRPGGSMLSFGVTVLPDPPYQRWLELIQLAEQHGFEYAWTYDSHVLWQESIPLLAVAARETSKIKLGHFVTNPATRDPTVLASAYATLHDLSDGRMAMGIGRGDSAVRYIGRQPMKVAEFEAACAMVKEFMNGREVNWNDKDLQLKWVRPELPEIPMWVAGYGPKALAVAGRVGDGVIIQLADPEIITWIMDTARKAAEEAGRDPSELKCIVGAPSHVTDDLADARDQVRWFPAMVSNHVMDLIERYGTDGSSVPKALTDYVQARKFYDYNDHSRVGAAHGEFVTDEICDRFCVIGNAEQIKAKLKELEGVGVDQFNVYLMTHGQEETLQAYGDEIIPQFAGVAA